MGRKRRNKTWIEKKRKIAVGIDVVALTHHALVIAAVVWSAIIIQMLNVLTRLQEVGKWPDLTFLPEGRIRMRRHEVNLTTAKK